MPRFQNLDPPHHPHPLSTVFKWAVTDRLRGRRRSAPRQSAVPTQAPKLALIASHKPSLTWVGHATWLLRLRGVNVVTDPVWSNALGPGLRRNVAPGLTLDQARPQVVLISHNHRDHLDAPSVKRIGPDATYVVPRGLASFFVKRGLSRVVELDWWSSESVAGLQITFVPSQHWSQRSVLDKNQTLWGGYVVEAEGVRVYFAGDTAYFAGFAEIGQRFPQLDAALLPIGAYDPEWFMRSQHMNPLDALQAFLDLGAKRLCAMHWGTFKLTDEPLNEPPELLERARLERQVERHRVWVGAIGETLAL